MVKEKWQRLIFREKLLLISGITVILSIPFILITNVLLLFLVTFFVAIVFYNLYKFVKTINKPLQVNIITNTKEVTEICNSCRMGVFWGMLTIAIGVLVTVTALVYLWVSNM